MDTETRRSLNSKSFLYMIKTTHLSDEPFNNPNLNPNLNLNDNLNLSFWVF